jgi:hypothetical protein
MKKISIIVSGRDDNYGDKEGRITFIDRMYKSISSNYDSLKNLLNVEYVVVDWGPEEGKELYKNNKLKNILSHKDFKNIIVSRDSIGKRGLNSKRFYEYFAKNVGVLNSIGEYILVTNPDGIFDKNLIDSIVSVCAKNDDNKYYRPYSRIDVDDNLNFIQEGLSFPKNGVYVDEFIGTPAAGDFLLCKKEYFVNIATGYEEEYIFNGKLEGMQTYCDGRILINLLSKGIEPFCLKGSILSYLHDKHSDKIISGHLIPGTQYENLNKVWGFQAFNLEKINENTYTI